MGKPMIVVGSITYAILLRHGIQCSIERIYHSADNGCGYSIYVFLPQRANEAEQILRQSGIPVVRREERGDRV